MKEEEAASANPPLKGGRSHRVGGGRVEMGTERILEPKEGEREMKD